MKNVMKKKQNMKRLRNSSDYALLGCINFMTLIMRPFVDVVRCFFFYWSLRCFLNMIIRFCSCSLSSVIKPQVPNTKNVSNLSKVEIKDEFVQS